MGRPTKVRYFDNKLQRDGKSRYYRAIKEMTKESDWLQKRISPDQPIREGRTMEDPDFPRIAITYLWMRMQQVPKKAR